MYHWSPPAVTQQNMEVSVIDGTTEQAGTESGLYATRKRAFWRIEIGVDE
jgi:hypothetical protein